MAKGEDTGFNPNRIVDKSSHSKRTMISWAEPKKTERTMISWAEPQTPEKVEPDYEKVYPDIEPDFGIVGAVLGKGNMLKDGGALLRLPLDHELKHSKLIKPED
jgi:hypothetical protein